MKEKELYDKLIVKNSNFLTKVEEEAHKNPLNTINYSVKNEEVYKRLVSSYKK